MTLIGQGEEYFVLYLWGSFLKVNLLRIKAQHMPSYDYVLPFPTSISLISSLSLELLIAQANMELTLCWKCDRKILNLWPPLPKCWDL